MEDTSAPETWNTIAGYEGDYEVSDRGRVRSLPGYNRAGGFLKPRPTQDGHLRVDLSRGNRAKSMYVHRLVLIAFVGPCPEGMEGCHFDGNPSNNVVSNLRWDTRSANILDAVRHGTHVGWRPDRRDECIRGHSLVGANVVHRRDRGTRQCRACNCAQRYASRRGVEMTQELADRYYLKITNSQASPVAA